MKTLNAAILLLATLSVSGFAVERPGGLTRTATNLPAGQYEVLLSPAYTIAPGGAYLTAEMRYQTNEDLAVGFGFGAGEVGFNFGGNAVWHIAPELENQPAFALMGGLYYNKFDSNSYFVLKATPIVSKSFSTSFGKVSPYAGLHVTPSFRLNEPAENQLSLKASTGLLFNVTQLSGISLWGEFGVGVLNSNHEVVFGLSYPFAGI